MTREVFLNSLREKLKGLSPEDIEDRISFYYEMIDDIMDEGKTEEEAVAEIGSVDDVIYEIAQDTPLVKIVKQKIKPKRKLEAWEIVLIILGFPLWFPLVLTGFVLLLVAYILFWVFVIVAYAVEFSLGASSIGALVNFFAYLVHGDFYLAPLGASIMFAGGTILMFFACKAITLRTIKLHKSLFTKIKASFIKNKKGGESKWKRQF